MTFGSLFSGIGGMDLGLERAGMECRWQVEIDPFCTKVLERHWPGVKRYGDIKTVTELEYVDVMCGGFPCQDLSQAGKRAGIEGTRSGLWFEFARLIGIVRPRYVLIENVPGLLVHDAMRRVIGELARLGYVGCWRSLRASEFGAAHLRKRVFIVAYTEHPRSSPGRPEVGCETTADNARGRSGEVADRACEFARRESVGISGSTVSPSDCAARYELANARREHFQLQQWCDGTKPAGIGGAMANGPSSGRKDGEARQAWRKQSIAGNFSMFAPGPSDPRWPAILAERPDLAPALESPIRGMANGLPVWMVEAMSERTKRLSRLGNAVVPQVAQWIGERIMEFSA